MNGATRTIGAAELIVAAPIFQSVRERADRVLGWQQAAHGAASLARDAKVLCDVIERLAEEEKRV